mgnify:FL=1|tara:strand:+ start:516 stop:770 length:255 start_codon:yes stop_codon:yes gene_type:complete
MSRDIGSVSYKPNYTTMNDYYTTMRIYLERAVEILQTKYGIDARIYENNLYLSVWNDELSDTIDVQVSDEQIQEWAKESIEESL